MRAASKGAGWTGLDRRRAGAIAVITAALMTVLIGFLALMADIMVIAAAHHQLCISADAGALAGADGLADERRLAPVVDLDPIFSTARGRARDIATLNKVLRDAPVVRTNAYNSEGGDIVLGYLADPLDPSSPFLSDASYRSRYNSVRVRTARTDDRGGPVPPFFSRVLGNEGTGVSTVSTATALNYSISGFRITQGRNADILPIILDYRTYDDMIDESKSTTDQFRYDPDSKRVLAGPDGVEESQLYPVKNGYPGNWGTVKIGVSNNSTKTLGDQIRNGVTPQQLAMYPGGTLELGQVDSKGEPYTMLDGNPGISSGIKDDLEAIIGLPRTIPLYDPDGSGGNGNNTKYKIVGFAPIRVLSVNFKGIPKYVVVQPALTYDPSAIPGEVREDWSAGGMVRVHLTR